MNKNTIKQILRLFLLLILVCVPVIAEKEEEEVKKTPEQEEREKKEALEKRLAEEQEIKAQFGYTFNEISDKIVTITCDSSRGRSSGSGFIATMDGKTYLFTNQHVIMGADKISFKSADGKTLRPRSVELSTTRDIARLLLADGPDGFEITGKTSVDSPIGVFGNSEGGGVATELYGKVTNLGSEIIDVSADFVSGNSGSPALNLDQQVVGIASSVQWSNKDEHGNETRHFCYRLTDVQWKRVNWEKYNAKYGKSYRNTEQLIDSIFEAVDTWSDDPFSRMTTDDHPDVGLREWSVEHNRMVNRITRMREEDTVSQHKLDNTNKRIKQDMGDSAEALSAVCRNRERQMRMLSEQRELTGFLKENFEKSADRLEYAALRIDIYGKILSKKDLFYFKE